MNISKRIFRFSTVLVLAVIFRCSEAEDWTQFRGPTGQGTSTATKMPVRWSQTQNVVWKIKVPGKGWSSPVLHGDKLFLTTAVNKKNGGLSLRAICFNAATGEGVWDGEVFDVSKSRAGLIHQKNSYATPTPLIADERLFVHFGHLGTACLDLKGKGIWRNTQLNYPPVHGGGSSPILAGDNIVFSCDGSKNPFVAALDRRTGRVAWKRPRDTRAVRNFSFSTPLAIKVKGRELVVSPGSDAVFAYAAKTGKEIWRVRYKGGYSVVPRPVYGQGLVFVCSGFGQPILFAINPEGWGDITETHVKWKMTAGVPNTPSLLLVGDELTMVSDHGVATCVDARTGKEHWKGRIGGAHSSSPLYADGKIYFLSEQGMGVVIKAGKTFSKIASNALNERALASYAIGDGALFIRTEQHLYRIEEK